MSSTSIRLSKEAKARLDRFKQEGESYEDVIMRLTERDKWAGFGALSEGDTDTVWIRCVRRCERELPRI